MATMPRADPVTPTDAVETAIAHVLEAERASRDAIVRAQSDATAIAEAARAAARALQARTERRIRAVRGAFLRRTDTELAVLDAQGAGRVLRHELTGEESRRIDLAVAQVAIELTGATR